MSLGVLAEPFGYEFFIRGLIAAGLAGALCGLLGVFITLRGMSYIGHGLSHAVLGGAVVSYVMDFNFYIGAGLWGFAAALLIHAITRRRQIGADAAIGIVTTASFAVGVALISHTRRFTKNFEAALFGNVLGVKPEDLLVLAGVTLVTIVIVFFLYKPLLFVTFDPEVAPTYGVSVNAIDAVFSLMLSAAIIASTQILGVTMIAAAIVIPAVIARLLTDRFSTLLIVSTVVGAVCGFSGIYSSYYLDVSSGATVVLFAAMLFLVVLAALRLRSMLWARDNARPSRAMAATLD